MSTDESREDEEYKEICKEHKHLIETLPNERAWHRQQLYNYNGFWISSTILKANFLLRTYFQSQPSDIFLASYVKAGTTWMKALMFSTINRHRFTFSDHPLRHHTTQSIFPFIDIQGYPITNYTHLPQPRLFATHLAHTLLPPSFTSCKFVYVCRDPKDLVISQWHYMNQLRPKDLEPLTLDEAFELFCKGISEFGPFWEHVLSYWKASLESPDKILFIKYEEMKKQPMVEVRKLAAFMGKPFTAEEEEEGVVEEIVKLCSFENLSNLEVNKKGVERFGKHTEVESRYFFRIGEVGDWKNYLSKEMKERIDGITSEKMKDSGLILGPSV